MFLSIIYGIFGIDNFSAVRIVQILLDLASGLFIRSTAKKLFGSKISRVAFILYMINPFTSSYTGLILGETLLVFLVSAIAYILVREDLRIKIWYWMLLGALFGAMVQIKISYAYFLPVVTALVIISMKKNIFKHVALAIGGFLIVSAYALISHYAIFQRISVIPPYRMAGGMLYSSFSVGRYPEQASELSTIHPEWSRVIDEYYVYVNSTPELMGEYDKKYTDKFVLRLKEEWPVFVKNTVGHIANLWDKYFLILYTDPYYPQDALLLRLINIALLLFGVFGISQYGRKPIVLFTLLYATLLSIGLGTVTSESRLTIPVYPLVILWASYGLVHFHKFVRFFPRKNVS